VVSLQKRTRGCPNSFPTLVISIRRSINAPRHQGQSMPPFADPHTGQNRFAFAQIDRYCLETVLDLVMRLTAPQFKLRHDAGYSRREILALRACGLSRLHVARGPTSLPSRARSVAKPLPANPRYPNFRPIPNGSHVREARLHPAKMIRAYLLDLDRIQMDYLRPTDAPCWWFAVLDAK